MKRTFLRFCLIGVVRISLMTGPSLVQAEEPALVIQGGHTSIIGAIAFNEKGTLLATAGSDGRVLIWDVQSGLTLRVITVPGLGQPTAVGFTSDSSKIAVGGVIRRYGIRYLQWSARVATTRPSYLRFHFHRW